MRGRFLGDEGTACSDQLHDAKKKAASTLKFLKLAIRLDFLTFLRIMLIVATSNLCRPQPEICKRFLLIKAENIGKGIKSK